VDWARDMAANMNSPRVAAGRDISTSARVWHGAFKNAVSGAVVTVHHDPALDIFDDPDFPISVAGPVGWAHSVPHGDVRWADATGPAPSYGPAPGPSAAATPSGRPWFIHVAEGTDERAEAELGVLVEDGCIGPFSRLVHGVGLGSGAAVARAAGAALIWCPSANQFLLGAQPRVEGFLPDAWALGTDSRLTGGRDLLDEVSLAAIHPAVTAADLVDALTSGGRRLLGAAPVDPTELSDLVVLPAGGPSMAAFGNSRGATLLDGVVRRLASARRGDVALVVARGRPLVASGELTDVFAAAGEACLEARIDGRTKWLAPRLLTGWADAGIREKGLVEGGAGAGGGKGAA
jgi:hypothetical protein